MQALQDIRSACLATWHKSGQGLQANMPQALLRVQRCTAEQSLALNSSMRRLSGSLQLHRLGRCACLQSMVVLSNAAGGVETGGPCRARHCSVAVMTQAAGVQDPRHGRGKIPWAVHMCVSKVRRPLFLTGH